MTAGPFIRINFKTFSEFHLHIAAANENKCSAGSQQLGQRLCGWSAARTKALQVVEVHFRSVSFILLTYRKPSEQLFPNRRPIKYPNLTI